MTHAASSSSSTATAGMAARPAIALITGGSRGLGRNAALHVARSGTDVILTYRSQAAEAQAVVAEIEALGRRAVALPLDVAASATFTAFAGQMRDVLARHWQRERFDFLVNNAGVGVYASFMETTEAQFDDMVNIHLKGVFFLTQKLLPLMNDGGRILNVSSGLARFALPGYAAYAAMKGGVEVLTRYLAKELGARHCRERGGAWRDRDGFWRRRRARQRAAQRLHRRPDRAGPRGPAGRHRWRDRCAAAAGHGLGERAAHRGIGRHVRLTPGAAPGCFTALLGCSAC